MSVFLLTTDHPLLVELAPMARAAFDATYRQHNPDELIDDYLANSMTAEKLASEVADPANIFIGFDDEGALAGYVKLREKAPDSLDLVNTIEIERIYAAAGHTGKGIGKALMQAAVEKAAALGKSSIWLGVWEHNEGAFRFYEREGFEQKGTVTFMMADDPQTDRLMVRDI